MEAVTFLYRQPFQPGKTERHSEQRRTDSQGRSHVGCVGEVKVKASEHLGRGLKLNCPGFRLRRLCDNAELREIIHRAGIALERSGVEPPDGNPSGCQSRYLIEESGRRPVALGIVGRGCPVGARSHRHRQQRALGGDAAAVHHGKCQRYIWSGYRLAREVDREPLLHKGGRHEQRGDKLRRHRGVDRHLPSPQASAADAQRRIPLAAEIFYIGAAGLQGRYERLYRPLCHAPASGEHRAAPLACRHKGGEEPHGGAAVVNIDFNLVGACSGQRIERPAHHGRIGAVGAYG